MVHVDGSGGGRGIQLLFQNRLCSDVPVVIIDVAELVAAGKDLHSRETNVRRHFCITGVGLL